MGTNGSFPSSATASQEVRSLVDRDRGDIEAPSGPQAANPAAQATVGVVFETSTRSLAAVGAAQNGAVRIQEVAAQFRNASPEQLSGRLAEELHAAAFNVDAALKGQRELYAKTGAACGAGTAAADVTITKAGMVVDHAQLKYHGSPASTTFEVSRVTYDGMQRVVPSDQVGKVRELAGKRGIDQLGQRNYPDVASSASDRLRAGNVESKPLSRTEALDAAKNPQKVAGGLVNTQIVSAVKKGAVAGAAVGGGISAISNIVAYSGGKKSGSEAAFDTIADTAGCAVSGAAVSAVGVAARATLVRVGAGALASGAAPVAIGLALVEIGKDVGRAAKGDISGEKLAIRAAGNIAKGGCTWGGMEGGAAVGTLICPGVGTIVGGIIGGIAGGLFGGWLFG